LNDYQRSQTHSRNAENRKANRRGRGKTGQKPANAKSQAGLPDKVQRYPKEHNLQISTGRLIRKTI